MAHVLLDPLTCKLVFYFILQLQQQAPVSGGCGIQVLYLLWRLGGGLQKSLPLIIPLFVCDYKGGDGESRESIASPNGAKKEKERVRWLTAHWLV